MRLESCTHWPIKTEARKSFSSYILTRNQGFMAHLINLSIYLSISFAKCESPRWEAEVRGRSGRPWEAEVGGHGSPRWEAMGGRSGRLKWEAKVGGRSGGRGGRPQWEAEVGGRGGGQGGRPRWEAARGRSGRPWESKVGGHVRGPSERTK